MRSARVYTCAITRWHCPFSVTRERKDAPSRMFPAKHTSSQRDSCSNNRTLYVSLISLDCLQLRELALHGACRPVRRRACRCSAAHNVICMCGLEFYTPGTGWRQAHMQGRWAILRLMIECGSVDIIVRADVVASSAVTPCFAVRRSCVIGPGLPPHPLEKGHARRC